MSYDTDVRIDTGSGELSEVAEVGNITSNIGRMFYAAMPGPFEGGGRYDGTGEPEARGGLTGLSGLLCRDALPFIAAGLDAMRDREVEMRAMEPGNGWGQGESPVWVWIGVWAPITYQDTRSPARLGCGCRGNCLFDFWLFRHFGLRGRRLVAGLTEYLSELYGPFFVHDELFYTRGPQEGA